MPGDINAYALSLEMTLQDNATPALRAVMELATTVENQVANLQKQFDVLGKSSMNFAKNVQAVYTSMATGATDVARETKAVSTAKKEMTSGPDAEAGVDIAKEELGLLSSERELNKKSHKEYITFEDKHKRMITAYHKAVKIFADKNKKDYKGETLSKKELGRLDIKARGEYENIQKLKGGIHEFEKKSEDGAKKRIKTQESEVGVIGRAKDLWGTISGAVTNVAGKIGSFLDTAGLGTLTAATSLTGLFTIGVLGAAKQQELFHTINYRQVGTMSQMAEALQDASLQTRGFGKEMEYVSHITMEERAESLMALRAFGANKEQLEGLTEAVGSFRRATGADIKATSQFTNITSKATGNMLRAKNMLVLMTKFGKENALTGEDMNEVMTQTSENTYLLGSRGPAAVENFTTELLKSSAAAKELGINSQVMTSMVTKMQDPMNTMKLLVARGRADLKWASPEERQKVWDKEAVAGWEHIKVLQAEAKITGNWKKVFVERQKFATLTMDVTGKSAYQLDATMEGIKKKLEMGDKIPKINFLDPKADKQLADAAKSTEGLERTTNLVADEVSANIMKAMRPVLEIFENLMKSIRANPMIPAMMAWGAIIVAVGLAFVSVLGGIIMLVGSVVASVVMLGLAIVTSLGSLAFGAVGLLFQGIGLLTGTKGVGGLKGAVGGLGKSLLFLGQATLVAAAAFIGWEIGKKIDEVFGLSEALGKLGGKFLRWWGGDEEKEQKAHDRRMQRADEGAKEKIALQQAFREATKRGDKAAMDEIAKRQSELDKKGQDSYEATAQGKARLAEQMSREAEKKAAHEIELKKELSKEQDMTTKDAQESMMTYLTEQAALTKQAQSPMAMTAKGTEPGTDILGSLKPLMDKLGPMVSSALGSLKEYMGPALQKLGPTISDAFKVAADYLGPAFEKAGIAIKEAFKEYGPKVGEFVSQGAQAIQKAIEEPISKAKPATINTVKTDEETGRPAPETTSEIEKLRMLLLQQNTLLSQILQKIDPTQVKDIDGLLKQYLPEIAEAGRAGLSSAVTQW
jgi:hypothetical protein